MSIHETAPIARLECLPQDKGKFVAASFIVSFTATTIFSGGNVLLGCTGGIMGATVSLLDNIARAAIQQLSRRPVSEASKVLLQTALILSIGAFMGPIFGTTISFVRAIALSIFSPLVDEFMGWQLEDTSRTPSCIFIA